MIRTIPIDTGDKMRYGPSDSAVRQSETIRFIVRSKRKMLHEMVIGTLDELKAHGQLMKKYPGMVHDSPYMAHVRPGKKESIIRQFIPPDEFNYACLMSGYLKPAWPAKPSSRKVNPMQRRTVLKAILASTLASPLLARAARPLIEVYKTAGCGCCKSWIDHLKANGFEVNARNVGDTGAYRQKFGIPQALGSCHTGFVDGYALEGHVPAAEIKRLLAQRPKAIGLAVPAMPLGSPGMEGPRKDPYDVLLVLADGKQSVFKHYDGS
ncbi:MAG: hypothetical protein ACI9ZF_000260 [Bradyrhizobium sp.]